MYLAEFKNYAHIGTTRDILREPSLFIANANLTTHLRVPRTQNFLEHSKNNYPITCLVKGRKISAMSPTKIGENKLNQWWPQMTDINNCIRYQSIYVHKILVEAIRMTPGVLYGYTIHI